MIRGTKPKLTVVKQLTGSHAPINENPPEPQGIVEMPEFVKGDAIRLWNKYALQLEEQGVLTFWDVEQFGTLCCLMAEYQQLPEKFPVAKLTQMRQLSEMFGMCGPVSRERIKVKNERSEDPAKRYLA